MLKLIRLEVKKYKLFDYWKGVLIANLAIIAFLSMIFFIEINDGLIPFENFDMAMNVTHTMIRATFLIFSSVLIVKLVLDEYKNKSIDIMFTYPISRKKMMTAKLLIVAIFTFVTILLSTLFIGGLFILIDAVFDIIPGNISMEDISRNILTTIMGALACAGMSLIPLYFGMLRKSAPATIVSSIFLSTLTNSTSDNFTLFSIVAIPISLALIGVLIAFLSVRNIEIQDVR